MKTAGKLLLGVAGSVLISSAAMAADLTPITPPPPPPPPPAPTFAWAGSYAGVFAGYDFGFTLGEAGVQWGYNFAFGNFLAGIEVETGHSFVPAGIINAALNVHAGAVLADRVFIYGEGGIGEKFFAPMWNIGGGVEVAVTNTMSVFAEAKANFLMGAGFFGWQLTGGVNYHPGGGMMMAGGGGFDGLYFGTFGGWTTAPLAVGQFGVQAGYNFGFGNFLAGLEVETTHSFGVPTIVDASLNAHIGAVLANSILLYAEGGIGTNLVVPLWNVGGGVEYLFGQSGVGAFAEATAQFIVGGGGYFGTNIQGGINYHFGP
jgi:hypothetical protein